MSAGSRFAPQASRRWRRLLGPLHYTHRFWYAFSNRGIKAAPEWAFGPLVRFFAVLFFVSLRSVRLAIGANLEAVLGKAGPWTRFRRAWRTLHTVSWCHGERWEQLTTGRPTEVVVEGEDYWNAATAGGRGVVLVTAHVGHWEVGTHIASGRRLRHIHVVREEELDADAQAFFRSLFGGRDYLTVHFARNEPHLGVTLLGALRRGEVVALQGDRPSAWGKSVPVELFGRPFELPVGPASLARAAGVPMQPVFVFRTGRRRARLVFRPPIEIASTADREADLRRALERLAGDVEWAIRSYPHQWFAFRALWEGEDAPMTQNPPRGSE